MIPTPMSTLGKGADHGSWWPMGIRRIATLGLVLELLLGGCPTRDEENGTPADDDASDDDTDDTEDPVEVIHWGDYGSLTASPGGGTVLVRRIDEGDEWITDEYDRRYRPRLFQIDAADGSLRTLSERADEHLWFTAGDGALYVDDPDGAATLWFVDRDGQSSQVMDDFLGLNLDASGRFVIAQTPSPRRYTLFDTQTAEHLLQDSEEFVPWRINPDGSCVLGTLDETIQLWRPATDEWSAVQLAGGETPDGVVLFDSCERVWYVHGEQVGWIDLVSGDIHELATLDGTLNGPSVTVSPDEGRLYWIDGGGVHGADLSTDCVDFSLPVQFADYESSPDGRHLAVATMYDALGWCGPVMNVDLDAAMATTTTGIVCFELVGYMVFTSGGGFVQWSDGPYNAMISPVPALTELQYCPAFACHQPGLVDAGDRRLVVPWVGDPDGADYDGTKRQLSAFSLTDDGAVLTPFFTSDEPYDFYWYEFVRYTADAETVVFGNELVPHAEWDWPCPVELRAGNPADGTHWSLDVDVVDVEIDANDRLLYITGEPRHEESCTAWAQAEGIEPALHVVPASLWD